MSMTKRGMKPFDSVGNHASFHSDAEKGDEQGVIQSLRTIAQTNDYILDNGIIDILSRFCVLFLLLLLPVSYTHLTLPTSLRV